MKLIKGFHNTATADFVNYILGEISALGLITESAEAEPGTGIPRFEYMKNGKVVAKLIGKYSIDDYRKWATRF